MSKVRCEISYAFPGITEINFKIARYVADFEIRNRFNLPEAGSYKTTNGTEPTGARARLGFLFLKF